METAILISRLQQHINDSLVEMRVILGKDAGHDKDFREVRMAVESLCATLINESIAKESAN